MSEIVRLSYDVGAALDLTLYDPGTSETSNVSAVQVEPITMLAVDSAFERRTPVHIYVDEHKRITRVETLDAAPDEPEQWPPSAPDYVVISRIATQRQENLIAEVFWKKDPTGSEQPPFRTNDLLIHILCHGAFLSRRPLVITVDQQDVKRVFKDRDGMPDPDHPAKQR